MKSVPVEKCESVRYMARTLWRNREYESEIEAEDALVEMFSQALQAAKEERDVELLEKIIEMKDKQYEDRQILSVIQGELSIGSIINKHQ